MMSAVMLCEVMLSAVMLSVLAPVRNAFAFAHRPNINETKYCRKG
jgi:hypothetical protein